MIGQFLLYVGVYCGVLGFVLWGLHRWRNPIDRKLGDFFDKED